MTPPNPARGIAHALICLVLLAFMPIISNGRPSGFSALGFAFWLSVWETVFALPLFLWERRRGERGIFGARLDPVQKRRTVAVTLGMGAIFGLATLIYVVSMERAGAANASVALQTYPLFAILLEAILFRRGKTALELAFTALLLAALYYLATGGSFVLSGLSPWFLLALTVPLLWAIAHVAIREELGRTPITPAQVTLFRVGLSAVFLGLVFVAVEPAALLPSLAPGFQIWALVMGLVYYLELVIWFYAMRHISVSFASSITTPWPAFTMVLAALILGDTIQPYQVAAVVLVIAAIYGLSWAGLRAARR